MKKPFVEKYRPQDFSKVEGNTEVIKCVHQIEKTGIIPNMLFYGPPGTGKTTSIRIISKSLPNTSVLELNASDDRGIAIVRQTIKEFSSTYSRTIKLVILDEVDFMTKDAQNALRRIIEDYSNTTRFCLIANYPKKIISPILSRCTKFRFSPVKYCNKSIIEICEKENIEVETDGIKCLFENSYGDMRKVINDLQGIKKTYGLISRKTVLEFNGMMNVDIFKDMFDTLLKCDYDTILKKIENIRNNKSLDLISLIFAMSEYIISSKLKNKMVILKKLSEIECRINGGCNEVIQMHGLISVFLLFRDT